MFRLETGRECFYQWDSDRRIIVEDKSITEVHYCNRTDDCSLTTIVYEENGVYYSNVPNILLQTDWDINVYAYDTNYTKYSGKFKVCKRSKPTDYIYTETEVKSWEQLRRYLEIEIEDMRGMISSIPHLEIAVLNQLPSIGTENTLYLITNNDMENNLYAEYLYINNTWELLGSVSADIKVDGYATEDYVKDYVADNAQPKGNYALKTDIPTIRNMDYAGLVYDATPIVENGTNTQIFVDGGPYTATRGTVVLYKNVHYLFDGSKWNSIKTDTTEIKAYIDNMIGVIENGTY